MLEDFRRLRLYGPGRTRIVRRRDQDKGHRAQFIALRNALMGTLSRAPIPLTRWLSRFMRWNRPAHNRHEIGERQVEEFWAAHPCGEQFVSDAGAPSTRPSSMPTTGSAIGSSGTSLDALTQSTSPT